MRRSVTTTLMLLLSIGAASAAQLSISDKLAPRYACAKEIQPLCGHLERGERRLLQCISDNEDKLSQPCLDAMATLNARLEASAGQPMDY